MVRQYSYGYPAGKGADLSSLTVISYPNKGACSQAKLWFKACSNGKCLATKHHQTLFDDQTFYRLVTLFGAVWSCLVLFDKIWRPSNIRSNNLKHFFYSRVWWAMFCSFGLACVAGFGQPYQTCLARAFVPWHSYHACSAASIHGLICVLSRIF